MPGNKCTHCISFGSECTHFLSKRRSAAAAKAAAREGTGESECSKLTSGDAYRPFQDADTNTLVTAILDDTDVFFTTTPPASHKEIIIRLAQFIRTLQDTPRYSEDISDDDSLSLPPLEPNTEPSPAASDEISKTNVEVTSLTHGLKDMVLNAGFERVYGPASTVAFIKCALDVRAAYATEEDGEPDMQRRMEFWNARPVSEPSLIRMLVDLYFRTYNTYMTLLHRPTIERGIANGMHERHYGFGSLLLMICAVASRMTDDPRVYADKRPGAENSAGWQWYSQIRFIRRTYPVGPDLYELQAAALGVLYAHVHAAAIRLAQEIGAHKRRCTSDRIQDELYKRLYWVLVVQDIHVTSVMGRPRATGDEDINLEPLLEVDDEYWSTGFTQPPGQIAGPVYMNAFIRGVHILGVLCRTIYACRRPKMPPGMSVEAWEARVVSCIDTVLNKWLCTLPAHLRWDPTQPNEIYRNQAASLVALQCYIQIQAHRIGISSSDSTRSLSALSTCAQFARNCLRVLDVHSREGFIPWIHVQQAVFCSTAALMLYIWRTRERGKECEGDVNDVYKGIRLLQLYGKRWQPAGRHLDVIYNLFPRNGFHFDGSGTFVRVEKRKQSAPDESVASSSVSSSIATPLSNPEMAQTHVMLPDEHIAPPANTFAYTPPDPSLPHTQEEQHRLDELFQQHQWPTLPNKQDLLYVADNTHTQAQRPLFDFDLYDGSPEWGTVGMAGETIFASGASGLPFQAGHRPAVTEQQLPQHARPYSGYQYPAANMVLPEAMPPTGPSIGHQFTTETQWYRSTYI
ncbi:hypothetical protein K525DRAFT_209101 [Schizophyllum commune Loenen D]|nr:hypothetical protein K525DRAFT_209101 [Schizophyllum commune Loenen D]